MDSFQFRTTKSSDTLSEADPTETTRSRFIGETSDGHDWFIGEAADGHDWFLGESTDGHDWFIG